MGIGYGKKKESGPRSHYANWGGWCADPELEPELFSLLPGWAQAQAMELREILREHPEARAFETIDPGTGKPYPGQILIRDLRKKRQETRKALPQVPNWYRYDVPDSVPVALFEHPPVLCKWTPETTAEVMTRLEQHLTTKALVEACKGNQKGLSATKPVDGLFAFVWRVARFNAGLDLFTPVSCFLDLADGLGRQGFRMPDFESLAPLLPFFQKKAEELADAVGSDKYAAAQRYAKGMRS